MVCFPHSFHQEFMETYLKPGFVYKPLPSDLAKKQLIKHLFKFNAEVNPEYQDSVLVFKCEKPITFEVNEFL